MCFISAIHHSATAISFLSYIPTQHHMCSILFMVVPVYIAEISPKKLRGRFVSFNSVALSSGLLVRIQPLLTRLAKFCIRKMWAFNNIFYCVHRWEQWST